MNLERIEQLILEGRYEDALKEVEEIEKQAPMNAFYLRCKIIKSRCLLGQSEYKTALNIAQQVVREEEHIEEMEGEEREEIKVDALIIIAEALWLLGQYDRGLEVVEQGEKELQRLKIKQLPGIKPRKAALLLHKGVTLLHKDELDQALDCFQQSLMINEVLGNKQDITKILNGTGQIYTRKGELDHALDCFQRSLKISEELANEERMARSFVNIGVIYKLQGDLDKALDNYSQALTINEKLGDKRGNTIILVNMGDLYKDKGELDRALEFLQQSLEISEVLGNKLFIAYSVTNMGVIYHQKDELKKAFNHFERSIVLFEELGNKIDLAEVLFFLVTLTIDMHSYDQTQEYLQLLKQIHEQEENRIVSQRYHIALALKLKTSTQARDRVHAEILLSQIICDEVVDHRLTVIALLNKFELLISEISHYGDKEALIEAQLIFQDLIKTAKTQSNHHLLAEIYWLQSQLSAVQFDLNEARHMLTQAQIIAEEKGLTKLARKISKEHDQFLEKLDLWEELQKKDVSLIERIKAAKFDEIVNNMWKQKELEILEEQDEESIVLLLLSESGLPIYSKNFDISQDFDDMLVAGFISAINNFIQEAFGVSGCIDRIKHEDNSIIIKKIASLYFCYVYKGESYAASKRIENFTTDIQKSNIWKDLQKSQQITEILNQSAINRIDAIIDRIF